MAADRRPLRRWPGLVFGKLLGTGSGRTFTVTDADPRRWAVLAVWDDEAAADAFDGSPLVRRWRRAAEEEFTARLRPLAARGRWSRREPFGAPVPQRWDGPVAAITRARLTARKAATFWRAVPPGPRGPRRGAAGAAPPPGPGPPPRRAAPFGGAAPPVSADLHDSPGLRVALGIGEAPVGLQGTFSVWASAEALNGFAYGR